MTTTEFRNFRKRIRVELETAFCVPGLTWCCSQPCNTCIATPNRQQQGVVGLKQLLTRREKRRPLTSIKDQSLAILCQANNDKCCWGQDFVARTLAFEASYAVAAKAGRFRHSLLIVICIKQHAALGVIISAMSDEYHTCSYIIQPFCCH